MVLSLGLYGLDPWKGPAPTSLGLGPRPWKGLTVPGGPVRARIPEPVDGPGSGLRGEASSGVLVCVRSSYMGPWGSCLHGELLWAPLPACLLSVMRHLP